MKKRNRILFFSLLVVLLIAFAWFLLRQGEPVYQGKPLSYWLDPKRVGQGDEQEADIAIRAMGTDAIPTLLSMLGTKDTRIRRGLIKLSEKFDWLPLHIRDREEILNMAMRGFEALGPIAKPAEPALVRFLRDSDSQTRVYAAYVLTKIGSPAGDTVRALVDYLGSTLKTNTGNWWDEEKSVVAYALAQIGPAAGSAIPELTILTNELTNGNAFAGLAAQAALISIRGDPLLPILKRLRDTSNQTNWARAAWTLWFLGTNAAPAVPMLLTALQQTNTSIQNLALQDLREIHAHPELCIPAIIPLLQSTNSSIRSDAIEAIRAFGVTSNHLGIAEITKCLSDPDGGIREKAVRALKQIEPAATSKPGAK
jgi:HEAT repeat protein